MTQELALSILKTGGNVFLTGEPGSGKTHVINAYISYLEACKVPVAITASTGIAATHIGGMTIHAWSGIGPRNSLTLAEVEQIASKEKVHKRISKARVLIIDEISMLDAATVDSVNAVCRTIRQSTEPFGGLQVIFVGDFFQLPPITRRGESTHYAFESRSWDDLKLLMCYITEQYRQEDELFLGLLNSIRTNDIEDEHFTLLSEQKDIAYENIEPTRLYSHNADVDQVNEEKLRSLQGKSEVFLMTGEGQKNLQESLVKSCLSPERLELKEEALVMFTKNNFEQGYVNGTLGRVIGFDHERELPIVETTSGKKIMVEVASWEVVEDNKVLARITQLPLRLAWAITIHKSQGMSLDAAEIDLSKAFVFGQGYVALSRVRTLSGLKMLGMSPYALKVDPKIVAYDERFRTESEHAENTFLELDESEVEGMHKNFVHVCGGIYTTKVNKTTKRDISSRIKKESTTKATKDLLLEKKSIKEIARERNLTQSTIWGHIEKLLADGELISSDVSHLRPKENWKNTYRELAEGFDELGTEKLKPVFEFCGEKFDYDTVRLARIEYVLQRHISTG